MNQQSTQKALLDCQIINKRRYKDEYKVLQLLEKNLRELQEQGQNQAASGQGSSVRTPPQFGMSSTQDFKCEFNQRSACFQATAGPLIPPFEASLGSGQHQGTSSTNERESGRQMRGNIDTMLHLSGRSHQNAVNMAKAVSRVLDLLKQPSLEESAMQYSMASMHLASDMRRISGKTLQDEDDRIRANQKLTHNKQPIHIDEPGDPQQLNHIQSNGILSNDDESHGSKRYQVEDSPSKQLVSQGIKCLDKLKRVGPVEEVKYSNNIKSQVLSSQSEVMAVEPLKKPNLLSQNKRLNPQSQAENNQEVQINIQNSNDQAVSVIKRKRGRPSKKNQQLGPQSQIMQSPIEDKTEVEQQQITKIQRISQTSIHDQAIPVKTQINKVITIIETTSLTNQQKFKESDVLPLDIVQSADDESSQQSSSISDKKAPKKQTNFQQLQTSKLVQSQKSSTKIYDQILQPQVSKDVQVSTEPSGTKNLETSLSQTTYNQEMDKHHQERIHFSAVTPTFMDRNDGAKPFKQNDAIQEAQLYKNEDQSMVYTNYQEHANNNEAEDKKLLEIHSIAQKRKRETVQDYNQYRPTISPDFSNNDHQLIMSRAPQAQSYDGAYDSYNQGYTQNENRPRSDSIALYSQHPISMNPHTQHSYLSGSLAVGGGQSGYQGFGNHHDLSVSMPSPLNFQQHQQTSIHNTLISPRPSSIQLQQYSIQTASPTYNNTNISLIQGEGLDNIMNGTQKFFSEERPNIFDEAGLGNFDDRSMLSPKQIHHKKNAHFQMNKDDDLVDTIHQMDD